jgi:cytochrome b
MASRCAKACFVAEWVVRAMIAGMVARAATRTARAKIRATAITKHVIAYGPIRRECTNGVPPLGQLLLLATLSLMMLVLAISP